MGILHSTSDNFDNIKNTSLLLVDFWAGWCMPCKMVAPVIEDLAEEYKDSVTVAKADVDSESAIASKFGIESIPTVVIFKDGVEKKRLIGVQPIEKYRAAINSLL